MTISVGEKMPSGTLMTLGEGARTRGDGRIL